MRCGYRPPKGVVPKQLIGRQAQFGNSHTRGRVMPEHEKLLRSLALKGRKKSATHREKLRLAALRRWERHRKLEALIGGTPRYIEAGVTEENFVASVLPQLSSTIARLAVRGDLRVRNDWATNLLNSCSED
jgi:hypothetical protein